MKKVKNLNEKQKLTLDKFTVAELNNPRMIMGGGEVSEKTETGNTRTTDPLGV
ncbi:hypothetical protein NAT51_10080 [Flavobacterium amniphilum]|uniref:hypothetical protein n=1 Tax=Flavobacterium amniphilum TaxID=1834035 RepID=UPI00202A86B9|nr:hypothetical protein [Flavobacterium amniphilum]MCL9805871.1 hypothetical protein [Flavobacterium amniphilum]